MLEKTHFPSLKETKLGMCVKYLMLDVCLEYTHNWKVLKLFLDRQQSDDETDVVLDLFPVRHNFC